jgi:glycosyltransferase involved in cell wall biosynthesis
VIGISEKVREQVLQGGSNLRTEVVYNGVDERRFAPVGAANDPPVILSVGNLIPIKGHEWLMRSLAQIRQQNWRWDVIGTGPELPRLRSLATELEIGDKVRFVGRQSREQVAKAMQTCTLFALPSRYEGLGCVYLEAMSSGKPVIACRNQGIDEVIVHGADGWLVDPSDQETLPTALTALLQDSRLRQKMGAAARQTILQNYRLADQAARLAGIYEECMR